MATWVCQCKDMICDDDGLTREETVQGCKSFIDIIITLGSKFHYSNRHYSHVCNDKSASTTIYGLTWVLMSGWLWLIFLRYVDRLHTPNHHFGLWMGICLWRWSSLPTYASLLGEKRCRLKYYPNTLLIFIEINYNFIYIYLIDFGENSIFERIFGALERTCVVIDLFFLWIVINSLRTLLKYFIRKTFSTLIGQVYIAEEGFDPPTSGLWAQHASAAPLCW